MTTMRSALRRAAFPPSRLLPAASCAALLAALLFAGGAPAPAQTAGTIDTIAGTGTAGYSATEDGAAAASARLSNPHDVAVDAAGNVYIADRDNNRIRRIEAATGNIST